MVADFPRTLSLLRQEKGISQRSAAASLKVSQALLSHYENGAREPGLDFLIRAAEFYGVTTDYLLGRTMSRDGQTLPDAEPELCSSDADPDASARVRSRLILNSAALLFRLLERTEETALTDAAGQYLTMSVYKVFRYLCMANPDTPDALFSIPQHAFAELCDAEMKQLELQMKLDVLTMANGRSDMPKISHAALTEEYPQLAQSMLSLLHLSGEELKKYKIEKI